MASAFAYFVAGWSLPAAGVAGIALSDTAVVLVYAVRTENGLARAEVGKVLMAACFVTNLGLAIVLSLLFVQPTLWLLPLAVGSALLVFIMPMLASWFFDRYGNSVIEPGIKGAFAALLLLMVLAEGAQNYAVLPTFLLGLAVAKVFTARRLEQERFRVVAFALLIPFFSIKTGISVSLATVWGNLGLVLAFLAVKLAAKIAGVFPFARRYLAGDTWFLTLLMSTGMTFGIISSFYGLRPGIIDEAQFSILVSAVVLGAILPTFVAQRFFLPRGYQQATQGVADFRGPASSAGL